MYILVFHHRVPQSLTEGDMISFLLPSFSSLLFKRSDLHPLPRFLRGYFPPYRATPQS